MQTYGGNSWGGVFAVSGPGQALRSQVSFLLPIGAYLLLFRSRASQLPPLVGIRRVGRQSISSVDSTKKKQKKHCVYNKCGAKKQVKHTQDQRSHETTSSSLNKLIQGARTRTYAKKNGRHNQSTLQIGSANKVTWEQKYIGQEIDFEKHWPTNGCCPCARNSSQNRPQLIPVDHRETSSTQYIQRQIDRQFSVASAHADGCVNY